MTVSFSSHRIGWMFGLMVALLMGGGCSATSRTYTLTIVPDSGLGAVEVDVVAVSPNEQDKALWDQLSVDEYWRSGTATNQLRQDRMNGKALVNFQIRPGQTEARQVGSTAALWARSPHYVALICNLPGQALPGTPDRRRVLLPTRSGTWVGEEIKVRLQRSGFDIITPQQAK